ncbi:hypothetical protein [Sigmofec virus UA08Rod_4043]|uniref:Uncharacterized protein n=1 Tax=Sigmofec virus UA08Rod_4043 TaxID=2929393 RepID=A0A976R5D9_9VIRU|nr:hypothetical protein [Sigmofec virus UA08Rod_4043]
MIGKFNGVNNLRTDQPYEPVRTASKLVIIDQLGNPTVKIDDTSEIDLGKAEDYQISALLRNGIDPSSPIDISGVNRIDSFNHDVTSLLEGIPENSEVKETLSNQPSNNPE